VPILGRVSEYNIASILNYESNGPTPIAPELEAVSATAPLGETLDLMSKHDYSQLGIEENGSISGVVSYRSVVETQLVLSEMDDYSGGWFNVETRLAATEVKELPRSADILELFEHLTDNTYAVVGDEDGVDHIITDYDLLSFLTETLRPFLQIEEVETALREIIRSVYDNPDNRVSEISGHENEDKEEDRLPPAESVSDCSFVNYSITISKDWDEVFSDVFSRDRDFTTSLIEHIGSLRNEIFHFRSTDRAQRRLLELDLATRYLEETIQGIE
jgi:hypothetical protein